MSKKGEERKEKERAFLENGSKPLEKLFYLATASLFSSIASLLNNYHNHQGIYWFKGSLKAIS